MPSPEAWRAERDREVLDADELLDLRDLLLDDYKLLADCEEQRGNADAAEARALPDDRQPVPIGAVSSLTPSLCYFNGRDINREMVREGHA